MDTKDWIGAGTSLLGIGLNQQGNQQQMAQQQQLMQQQFQNQQALNLQNQTIQQQNWDYTNYGNQVKHMENAGLNVGLMYGMGGGGGQSMGSGGGGTAASGNAPQNTGPQIMAQMLQAGMMQSEIERNRAQANDLNASADKKRGVDTENISQDTQNKITANEGIKLDNALKSGNLNTYIETATESLNNLKLKNENQVSQNKISQVEADNAVESKRLDLLGKGLENALMKTEIAGNKQATEESKQRIMQKWKELELQNKGLNQNQIKNNIENFKAETAREYPAVWSVIGKTMDVMVRGFDEWANKTLGKPREYK